MRPAPTSRSNWVLLSLSIVMGSVLLALTAASSSAFHSSGAASCQGCHVMHESEDGMVPSSGPAGEWLLRGTSPSEVCLACHAENQGQVLGSDPLMPPPEYGGGKFIFLVEDNLNDAADGALNPVPGHVGGHNVVAPGYGLYPDPVRITSPGGNYPSVDLSCTSCHDPHGNTNFRMLYGQGQETAEGFVFSTVAPSAEGIDLNGPPESQGNHTAYRQDWSRWCGNCHGMYHQQPGSNLFDHPSQRGLGAEQRNNYDLYDGTDNPTGGNATTAYLSEVPLESLSSTTTQVSGPDAGTRLNCMSCHRAHASSAPSSLRWDGEVVLLSEDGAASGSYPLPNPYIQSTQRSLCEKCHWSDVASSHTDLSQPCLSCHGVPTVQN